MHCTYDRKHGIKKYHDKPEIWHKISQIKFGKHKCKDLRFERRYQTEERKVSNY